MMLASGRVRANLSANFLGTVFSGLVALVSAPIIFRLLGADAYGLVGVYLLLQGLMPLFDLGITPGLGRAVAWHRGMSGAGQIVTLVKLAERPMWALALIVGLGLLALSGPISRQWLSSTRIPTSTIHWAIALMGFALALRMLAGLHKSALMAIEAQWSANLVQSVAMVARTLGALGVALATESGVLGFFIAQIPISLLEWWLYRRLLFSRLPAIAEPVSAEELRQHLRFGIGVAGLAIIWCVTSQIDKLALSRALTLAEYGGYSLGAQIASAVILGTGPIQAAVLPRLTRLVAANEESKARALYGMATALTVSVFVGLVVGILMVGATVSELVGTGSAVDIKPMQIAIACAIGNGGIAIIGLAYQLQNARGRLRLHAVGAIVQGAVQVPVLIFVAITAGALPTAIVFAGLNWLFLIFWMPIVHRRFLHGGNLSWLREDLIPPLVTSTVVGSLLVFVLPRSSHLLVQGTSALFGVGLTMGVALFAHHGVRDYFFEMWHHNGD